MPIEQFKSEVKERVIANGKNDGLKESADHFLKKSAEVKYSYNFSWLGRPIIQYPQDMVAAQELIWEVKPDLIIEAGIAHGGSLMLSASMLALLEYEDAVKSGGVLDPSNPRRKVLGIDIDIREHNRREIESHMLISRIDMIEGSSIADETIQQVVDYAKDFDTIMVFLDSNHTHDHVLSELNAYAGLVSKGSYCVVFDTSVDDFPAEVFLDRSWGPGNNPKTAVYEYLKTHPEFEIDKQIENKIQITVAPDGYLKKVK